MDHDLVLVQYRTAVPLSKGKSSEQYAQKRDCRTSPRFARPCPGTRSTDRHSLPAPGLRPGRQPCSGWRSCKRHYNCAHLQFRHAEANWSTQSGCQLLLYRSRCLILLTARC